MYMCVYLYLRSFTRNRVRLRRDARATNCSVYTVHVQRYVFQTWCQIPPQHAGPLEQLNDSTAREVIYGSIFLKKITE